MPNTGRSLALSFLLCACSSATRVVDSRPAPVRVKIPEEARGYRLTAVEPVRGAPAESLYRFAPPDTSETRVTVFVYDVPADVRGNDSRQEWANREGKKFQTVLDIQFVRGVYTDMRVAFATPDTITSGTAAVPGFMTVAAVAMRGRKYVEWEFVMLVSDQFLKVRATTPAEKWSVSDVRLFAGELVTRARR